MTPLFRSATFKLTLWYLLLIMLVSVTFSVVIYKIANDELTEGLHQQSARIYQTYPVFSNDPFFQRDTDLAVSAQHILTNLIYLNLAVFAGAGFASYWLARRTLQPIAAMDEQQKHFVADASHELRTPLTALQMETEVALMDSGATKTALRQALESNLEETSKLQVLLDSLLKLSRLEMVANLELSQLDVRPLIKTAVQRMAKSAEAKHITLETKLDSGPLVASADSEALAQLLVILLDNAIKYSADGALVQITARRQGSEAVISVIDHGIGIESVALAHVFDRFYRANAARTSNNGYGLGLSIAKYLADLQHGTITLTSAPGKGTTAEITLAAVSATDQPLAERSPSGNAPRPHRTKPGPNKPSR